MRDQAQTISEDQKPKTRLGVALNATARFFRENRIEIVAWSAGMLATGTIFAVISYAFASDVATRKDTLRAACPDLNSYVARDARGDILALHEKMTCNFSLQDLRNIGAVSDPRKVSSGMY